MKPGLKLYYHQFQDTRILKASRWKKHLMQRIRHNGSESSKWMFDSETKEKYQNCEQKYFIARTLHPGKFSIMHKD